MSINLLTHSWSTENKWACSFYPEITSTNEVAKNEFQKTNQDFKLYLADHQTEGKGRNQRTWQNLSQGEILLSTWCFRTSSKPQPILTPLLGLALYKGLLAWSPLLSQLRLKAPNDLYLKKGKLSGLLVEISQKGNLCEIFVGLGLNALGSPQIDQATSSLIEQVPETRKNWFHFCDLLLEHFQQAIQFGSEKTLTSQQQNELLVALNVGLPSSERIKEVSPHCDLITEQGTISWMDL